MARRRCRADEHQKAVSVHSQQLQTSTKPLDVSSTAEKSTMLYGISAPSEHGYFSRFEDFKENRNASFTNELNRLAKHQKWSLKEKEEQRIKAFEIGFNFHVGVDISKLEIWQQLCKDCRIKAVPTTIGKCRQALSSVHVNIVNLLDHRRNPERFKVIRFQSAEKLCQYTVPKYICPLKCGKENTFLRSLLHIFLDKPKRRK